MSLSLLSLAACFLLPGQVRLSIANLGHGSNAIRGGGVSGQGYALLAVANVAQTNWQTLGTVTANVSGAFVFIDSNASPQRFYRSVSTQANGVTNVTGGLLAWWKLDEGSGTNVADSSGNGRNGHFYVSSFPNNKYPVWTNGNIGSGLEFNRYECVETENFADSLSNYSVACWYRISPNTIPGQLQMVNKFDNGVGINGAGWVLMNESGDITFAWGGTSCYAEGGGDNHTDNAWNHVICSISGTNLTQWNNGVLVSQVQLLTCPFSSYSNTGPVRIGWSGTAGFGDTGFVGTLDDIRIYNRVLNSNEVQLLYRWRGEP